jgi:hypothetical protein
VVIANKHKNGIIDIKSSIDLRSVKLDKAQARKLISEIASRHPQNIRFSKHALEESKKDNLTIIDLINVIKSSAARILDEPELEKGSYRYRLATSNIMVVISFVSKIEAVVVTAWRKI